MKRLHPLSHSPSSPEDDQSKVSVSNAGHMTTYTKNLVSHTLDIWVAHVTPPLKSFPSATKEQLIALWHKKLLDENSFGSANWVTFAKKWNKELLRWTVMEKQIQTVWVEIGARKWLSMSRRWHEDTEYIIKTHAREIWLRLPESLRTLVKRLGGDDHISSSRNYVIALLEGREFKSFPVATKGQLQSLWNNKVFSLLNLGGGWSYFSRLWNESNSEEAWFVLPESNEGIVSLLGWDPKIAKSRSLVISLLEESEIVLPMPTANRQQLLSLWDKQVFTAINVWMKWPFFAVDWNEKNSQREWYLLPAYQASLITALGGDVRFSKSRKYIFSLFTLSEFTKKKIASKKQILALWKSGAIKEEYILGMRWRQFAVQWNADNEKTEKFFLPMSSIGLASILYGKHSPSRDSLYILSLLNGAKLQSP